MILRPPDMRDCQFLLECYSDWPVTETQGPVTMDDIKGWVRRWMARNDEIALIAEEDRRIGLVLYRPVFVAATIDNLIVHPYDRNKGYSRTIRRALFDKLTSEGVVVAVFKTLPGPLEGKYPGNRVTWDMEI